MCQATAIHSSAAQVTQGCRSIASRLEVTFDVEADNEEQAHRFVDKDIAGRRSTAVTWRDLAIRRLDELAVEPGDG